MQIIIPIALSTRLQDGLPRIWRNRVPLAAEILLFSTDSDRFWVYPRLNRNWRELSLAVKQPELTTNLYMVPRSSTSAPDTSARRCRWLVAASKTKTAIGEEGLDV